MHLMETTQTNVCMYGRMQKKNRQSALFTYISLDATFCGAVKHEPVKIAFVCCKPDGTSSNTGKPLRETISRRSC